MRRYELLACRRPSGETGPNGYLYYLTYNGVLRRIEFVSGSTLSIDDPSVRESDSATLLALGQAYLQQGDVDKAQSLFERLRSDNAARAAAATGLGKVALAKHQYREAADRNSLGFHAVVSG